MGTLVIDEADAALEGQVREAGLNCVVTPSIMNTPEAAASLARVVLGAVRSLGPLSSPGWASPMAPSAPSG